MLKRLTAMCLLVLTVMSSIPITALGAGVNADINAGGFLAQFYRIRE